ncbi:hypothetical protein CLOSTASPAR_00051 [[Clostridium] asparagiforme DSM 15981]|uniref:Uncharacterized protein n=1 Tax=[Clostridium] asparagiforme DSM 15981 TaxID=518636 RepID=C0CSV7_9FIRM|nr:hypothetical protein CLOSTASPAR_00051 [[Clostridium] asparagiforme DSM 15981]
MSGFNDNLNHRRSLPTLVCVLKMLAEPAGMPQNAALNTYAEGTFRR